MANVKRFFIALLPPSAMQNYANQVRQHFADHYNSRKAFNSPPHITLQSPFEWPVDRRGALVESLVDFARSQVSVPVILPGFGAFAPRVIFIDVVQSPELLKLQADLKHHCATVLGIRDRAFDRPFVPHMTVAFRDLTKENFQLASPLFQQRPLALTNTPAAQYQFMSRSLTLLQHDGQRWQIDQEIKFSGV